MSDVMLHGVLCMPPEMWQDDDPLDVSQRYQRYLQASRRIEEDGREIDRLRAALAELVALKDMKDRGFGAHDTGWEDEYMRRKPAAWQAARDALVHNVGFSGTPAIMLPEAPLERPVGRKEE